LGSVSLFILFLVSVNGTGTGASGWAIFWGGAFFLHLFFRLVAFPMGVWECWVVNDAGGYSTRVQVVGSSAVDFWDI